MTMIDQYGNADNPLNEEDTNKYMNDELEEIN